MAGIAQILVLCFALPLLTSALENGLARTPPMGWMSWERFQCNVDCVNDPTNCISERLLMEQADAMVAGGYPEFGYEYLIVDDCWMAMERDEDGKLVGHPERFPSGIKALADYIHSKGLKFGIYEDYGTHTCQGYPGVLDHLETDANTFGEWGVDYVKLDACNSDPAEMEPGYKDFGRFLNLTGRPMVYSCSWPMAQILSGIKPNWTVVMETCNLWRNWGDIYDSWENTQSIIDRYAEYQDEYIPLAAPGHWNDPDQLIIGNFGLSYEQSVAQMGMWAILAAPLIMTHDMRNISQEHKAILQNRDVIGVNQDSLGVQGSRIFKEAETEIWSKPVNPLVQASVPCISHAVAFWNRRAYGMGIKITKTPRELGLTHFEGYQVKDLFSGKDFGLVLLDEALTVHANPTGIVLLKFTCSEP